jgi:hypothetical protein
MVRSRANPDMGEEVGRMRHARPFGAVRPLVLLIAVALAVAACSDGSDGDTSAGGGAQGYPDRNITMVVPFSAGGPTDTSRG